MSFINDPEAAATASQDSPQREVIGGGHDSQQMEEIDREQPRSEVLKAPGDIHSRRADGGGLERDAEHMRRALELAAKGLGRTRPNPVVGCVIVDREGLVVGEGFHPKAGEPHAEVRRKLILTRAVRRHDQLVSPADWPTAVPTNGTLVIVVESCRLTSLKNSFAQTCAFFNFRLRPESKCVRIGILFNFQL